MFLKILNPKVIIDSEVIHLLRPQKFLKNQHLLQMLINVSFSKNIANVLNE